MIRKTLNIVVLLLFLVNLYTQAGGIPKLVKNKNNVVQLIVNDKPFVMLAGELMNSSSSTIESMAPRWDKLQKLNLNTILLPVAWGQIEPEEGKFDFAVVDGLIKEAKMHNLKIVFLWFGSWKNGSSGYAPSWVMEDTKRFPRMKDKNGDNRPYLSNFTEELVEADARALQSLMSYIKKVDSKDQTVLMLQIENEVGLLGDSRDRSPLAEELFNKEVPAELVNYIQDSEKKILPEITEQWKINGRKTKGTWLELFGNTSNHLADELFMGWNYARFIERVAAEGKKAYSIPMFVNAWTIYPEDPVPGHYPSGGPNSRMLDVYQFAAPSIDFLAIDNYNDDYVAQIKAYNRNGNPVFIPEAVALWRGEKWSGPAKAFYTLSEFNALCFSPFAIDNDIYDENHPLKDAYFVLNNLMPLMVQEQGSGKMKGFMQQENKNDHLDFGDYEVNVSYNYPYKGYGMVIRLSGDEFLVSGNGADISFRSKIKGLPGISYGLIREGQFVGDEWKTLKYLGGDESMQGVGGVKLPPVYLSEDATINHISIIRIKVIPVESSTYVNKNIFDQGE